MRFSANSAIADFMVAPGSMVVTSRPLAASMILTVIVASLRPSLAWHLYVLFPGPQIRYISISLISIPNTGVGPILPPRNLHAFALSYASPLGRQPHHLGEAIGLGIQLPIALLQLLDPAPQVGDGFQPLVQGQFEAADLGLLGLQLAAQLDQLTAQASALMFQRFEGAGFPGHPLAFLC